MLRIAFMYLLSIYSLSHLCQLKKKKAEPYCGVAEEAKYNHGKSRGEDGAEDDAGQPKVYQCYDHILCSDQHRTCPAVQRAS